MAGFKGVSFNFLSNWDLMHYWNFCVLGDKKPNQPEKNHFKCCKELGWCIHWSKK